MVAEVHVLNACIELGATRRFLSCCFMKTEECFVVNVGSPFFYLITEKNIIFIELKRDRTAYRE